MIIKANRHGSGSKLAAYLTEGGRHGERVEEPRLRGFGEAENIFEAFRDIDILAGATKAEKPLFHVQIRLPEGEELSRAQWDQTADRIQHRLGLDGQPRADVYHRDGKTGELHLHLAFSLIDTETLKVKELPFFKLRLKALARELEKEFGITRVRNERDSSIEYGATRAEEQQAQRLGFNKEAIRNTIRNCWDATDGGRDFDNALAEAGLILAVGDRRNYVVIDIQGGIHALGKRVLGASMDQVRQRLSDLDHGGLPSVEQARTFMLDLPRDRMEKLTREMADVQAKIKAEREYADGNPVREQIAWEDALATAAIEKERVERKFVETTSAGGRKKDHEQATASAPELRKTEAEIRLARSLFPGAQSFANALEDRGLIMACVNEAAAERLNRWEQGRRKEEWTGPIAARQDRRSRDRDRDDDKYRAGELVVVNQYGNIFQLTPSSTGLSRAELRDYLKGIDRKPLMSVMEAQGAMREYQQHRQQEREEAYRHNRNEKFSPVAPARPQHQSPDVFAQAAQEASRDTRTENLHGPAGKVWEAWRQTDFDKLIAAALKGQSVSLKPPSKEAFAAAIDQHGISFARASKDEANQSHRKAAFAREIGNYAPRFKEGEIVLITEPGLEYRREGQITTPRRVHKIDQSLAGKFVKALDIGDRLQTIDASLKSSDKRSHQRPLDREAIRDVFADSAEHRRRAVAAERAVRNVAAIAKDGLHTSVAALGKAASVAGSIGKTLDVIGGLLESLAAPKLTPRQLHAADRAKAQRQAQAED
ncbi:MAG: relaxase/mobilization nuclease domain-containing protein, partial [Bryobacteraceae bacterium]